MTIMTERGEDAARRSEELEALEVFYEGNVSVGDNCWTLHITSGIDLEIILPVNYPSTSAPIPNIVAPPFVLDVHRKEELEAQLIEMYQEDTEVAILWTEHVKEIFADQQDLARLTEVEELEKIQTLIAEDTLSDDKDARTFQPSSSKFGQAIRSFAIEVIENELNRRSIHRGEAFRPPKSGPAELMIAHVASVESMDHVNWVLSQLLFHDKKVAKASHNMIAYRFWDEERNCLVCDNDDDGEKGAGVKLAMLLEMAEARNVIVVVSRWYGGVHLGSSRFKYFASVARDALQDAGFIRTKK